MIISWKDALQRSKLTQNVNSLSVKFDLENVNQNKVREFLVKRI